ncbi:MAG: Gfo/Idh/MocA family protein [Sedimentisphaeraceae bacterium JB056]
MQQQVKQLRTAVIGLGRIGWQFHLPQLKAHKEFELTAVVDKLPERLQEAYDEYSVKGYTDYIEMLEKEKPDLVVIASPTKFHKQHVLDSFKYGCDVFCEKPVVSTAAEMDEIIEAKERMGRKFMAYQPHRGYNDIVSLKHIMSLGVLGRIYMIKRSCSAFTRRSDWQAFLINGGGMLNNYGSHFIDQLLYLAGSDISASKCITKKIACLGDADDVVKAVFETENGLVLDLDINMACAFEMRPWQVLGDCGSAVLDHDSNMWRVKYFVPEELQNVPICKELAAEGRSYTNGETIPWRLKEFKLDKFDPVDYYGKCYEYFALDNKPFVDITESKRLIDVIENCRGCTESI